MRYILASIGAVLLSLLFIDSSPAFLLSGGAAGPVSVFNFNTATPTPWMGWSTWYEVGGNSTQTYVEAGSDALVSTGLLAAGYKVVKVDIWSDGARDGGGNLLPNGNFTDMHATANYIKADGGAPMMYTDAGATPNGCGHGAGSEGFYVQDFTNWLVNWGYQGIMVDSCGIFTEGENPKVAYASVAAALNTVGVPTFLEITPASYGYNSVWEYNLYTATSAWIYSDVFSPGCATDMHGVLVTFWASNAHPGTTGPYHFAQASVLMTNATGLTFAEQQAQFALWTMMSVPLEIGCDIRNFSASQLAMLKNSDAIAIDQDPWVLLPIKVNMSYVNETEVYIKWLSTAGSRAVVLANENGTSPESITVNFSDMGLTGTATVYDVLNQTSLGTASTSYTATVPSNSVLYLRFTGATESNLNCSAFGSGQSGATSGTNCTWEPDPNGNYNAGASADGTISTTAHVIDTAGVTDPAPQTIYQNARIASPGVGGDAPNCAIGDDFWNLVPGATYKIRLHFAELVDTAAGQREFNVNLYNGSADTRVLTNFDVFATAGAQYKAVVEEFTETAPHGNIAVILSAGAAGCPMLAGAEAIKL